MVRQRADVPDIISGAEHATAEWGIFIVHVCWVHNITRRPSPLSKTYLLLSSYGCGAAGIQLSFCA